MELTGFLIIGMIIGFIAGFFIQNEKVNLYKNQNTEINQNIIQKDKEIVDLTKKTAIAETNFKILQEKFDSEQQSLDEKQKSLILQFQNISNNILELNTKKLSEKNIELLSPFKDKITEFEKKIQEEAEKRASLDTLIKIYQEQCIKISKEAQNLTNALKAETKKKGCWGEFILERILESSGLIKDINYTLQESFNVESGRNFPDAVVYLPDNRHVIIDSKVPLNSYERLFNTENNEEKEKFKKDFLNSVQNMIKVLSEREYEQNKGLNTPDFVLLFIPLEGAFSILYKESIDLIESAWNQKIIIVSPSTLLVALKTIEVFWREEKQAKYVRDIAIESGKLYDKFVFLLEDLQKMSKYLLNAQDSYEKITNKLKFGKGNILSQIQKIKKLGAITKKDIPLEFSRCGDNHEKTKIDLNP
ncbi:MAG: DNA recombination protein RmuC [bacterium]